MGPFHVRFSPFTHLGHGRTGTPISKNSPNASRVAKWEAAKMHVATCLGECAADEVQRVLSFKQHHYIKVQECANPLKAEQYGFCDGKRMETTLLDLRGPPRQPSGARLRHRLALETVCSEEELAPFAG